jgi:hypothetical protein
MSVQEAKKAPKLTLSKAVSLMNSRPSISTMQRAGRKRKQRAIKSKETNRDQVSTPTPTPTPNTPSSSSSQNSTPSKRNTRRNTLISLASSSPSIADTSSIDELYN